MLFALRPDNAVIGDINPELIRVYEAIRDHADDLVNLLKTCRHDEAFYYSMRNLDRDPVKFAAMTDLEKAARTIYLNRTCYNGLYRMNSKGQFNSPFGRHANPDIVREDIIRAVSGYLNSSNILFKCSEFGPILDSLQAGAFAYLDPPYDPVSGTANFVTYSKDGFDRYKQIELRDRCDDLDRRGVKFMLSNSATDFMKDLYKGYNIDIVKAKRFINSKADRRGEADEILVTNY